MSKYYTVHFESNDNGLIYCSAEYPPDLPISIWDRVKSKDLDISYKLSWFKGGASKSIANMMRGLPGSILMDQKSRDGMIKIIGDDGIFSPVDVDGESMWALHPLAHVEKRSQASKRIHTLSAGMVIIVDEMFVRAYRDLNLSGLAFFDPESRDFS